MPDLFRNHTPGLDAPALGAVVVSPSDTVDLASPLRAITLSVGGTLSFISSRDGSVNTTAALPAGTYPILAARIRATGTTATGLTGWI